jgi:uncharacterized membrane protein YagU involved in acid resistance
MAQHLHFNETQPRRTWLQGSLAGFIATGPMTLFMLVTQRYLPKRHRYALPPELIIWAASYLALLPLLGMSESGQREPVRRNLMMIAAHIVWGSTMGVLAKVLTDSRLQSRWRDTSRA